MPNAGLTETIVDNWRQLPHRRIEDRHTATSWPLASRQDSSESGGVAGAPIASAIGYTPQAESEAAHYPSQPLPSATVVGSHPAATKPGAIQSDEEAARRPPPPTERCSLAMADRLEVGDD